MNTIKNFFFAVLLSSVSLSTKLLAITNADVAYYPNTEEVSNYLNAMPWNKYKSYFVNNLGWFWVDNAKDCVKDEIKGGRIWEPQIIELIKKYAKPGDNVVDIGAHMGTISRAMSLHVGPNGKVFSFEGERQFFRELIQSAFSNNIKNIFPHLCWIGNENSEFLQTSFYGPEYSPVHSPEDRPWILEKRTLDSFNLKNISFMKIDVECTEDDVLAGAHNTIMESRPVMIVEIMGGFGNDHSARVRNRIKNTIRLLESLNYKVKLIRGDDYLAIPAEKTFD